MRMSGNAMSPALRLRRSFCSFQVRKEVTTDLLERDDDLAVILCQKQEGDVERHWLLHFEKQGEMGHLSQKQAVSVGPAKPEFRKNV